MSSRLNPLVDGVATTLTGEDEGERTGDAIFRRAGGLDVDDGGGQNLHPYCSATFFPMEREAGERRRPT